MTIPDSHPDPRHPDSRRGGQPSRENAAEGNPQGEEKPSVPLEKLIEGARRGRDTEAADRLASEAAKAPTPETETPDQSYPKAEKSVVDLVENERRQ